jgi:hypothetical protein
MVRSRILLASLACLACSARAAAEPGEPPASSPDAERSTDVEVLLQGAYGAGGHVDDSTINRFGPGIGVRAGVTLKSPRLYFGGTFVRFFGDEDGSGEYYTATLDAHVGYDLRLLRELLVIRPELAFGVAQTVTIQADNAGYPLAAHLAPGLLVGLRLRPLFAFAEVRADLLPSGWSNSVTALAGAGVVF